MALLDNLSSYWKFDDNLNDTVGSNNLTAVGSPVYASGKVNNGIDLERGSSQYVYVADTATLEPGSAFSIVAWVKIESTSAGAAYVIASKGTSTGNQRSFVFKVSNANSLVLQLSSAGSSFNGDVSVSWTEVTGTWVQLAVTFSSGSVKFYVNGAQQGSTQTSAISSVYNGTGRFGFGADNLSGTPSDFFDGMIDEAGFWQAAKTDADILRAYQAISYPYSIQYTSVTNESVTLAEAYTEQTNYHAITSESVALTETVSGKYGWVNQDKSATSTFTNETKS